MVYPILFLVRFFPFWAIPLALVMFEIGVYHYNRRQRLPVVISFSFAGLLAVASILWVVFEGYWKAGPVAKHFFDLLVL